MNAGSKTVMRMLLVIALAALLLPTMALPAAAAAREWPGGPMAGVAVKALNVRAGPGLNHPVGAVARWREILRLTGRNADNTWLRIERANGQRGWVYRPMVNVSGAHLSAVPVIYWDDPGTPPGEGPTGSVTARLNVRSGPGTTYPVIDVLGEGQPVVLVGRTASNAWLQIARGGAPAWVSTAYVQSDANLGSLPVTAGDEPGPAPQNGIVATDRLNLRSGPGLTHGVVGLLYQGQRLTILDRDPSRVWLRVQVRPGVTGWVHGSYVQVI